ncbi:MAG: hypothetical protein IJP31_11760 [Lachnospiraceae bacterium]|nr:hypothetical protein [Lachnospiraceae bacterium]
MKYKRTPIEAEANQYTVGQGMEDGFELWSDVVISGWIVTDFLVKITQEDGSIVCPYICHRRGRTFIGEGDYIIIEADGTKHVCGEDKFNDRFSKVEE